MHTELRPVCTDCGVISVPFFGFFAPCKVNPDGRHVHIEREEIAQEHVTELLRAAYAAVPAFDRRAFRERATSEEIERYWS